VIGIIVIVIALFVAPEVMKMLWLGNYEYLSPARIFNAVKVLMSQIFGTGGSVYNDPGINTVQSANFSDL
jgi:hypothetical protein